MQRTCEALPYDTIPLQPIVPFARRGVEKVRKLAPTNLQILNQHCLLQDALNGAALKKGNIQVLSGGEGSALYLLQTTEDQIIVKFRERGAKEEATFLKTWGESGASVPKVKSSSADKPIMDTNGHPIEYVIMQAIRDEDDSTKLAPTGKRFLESFPQASYLVGTAMGKQLNCMHMQSAKESFFGDPSDENSQYASWNDFLLSKLTPLKNTMLDLGFSDDQIEKLMQKVEKAEFPPVGVYAHGDYDLTNILVGSTNPLNIFVIDPVPTIADPYWDVTLLLDSIDTSKILANSHPTNTTYTSYAGNIQQVYQGFAQEVKLLNNEVQQDRLLMNRILHALFLVEYFEKTHQTDEYHAAVQLTKNQIGKLLLAG